MSKEIEPNPVILVNKALIVNGEQILLVQRVESDSWKPSCWEIPGGKQDPGEDTLSALKRELLEETGLEVELLYQVYEEEVVLNEGPRKGRKYQMRVFKARGKQLEVILSEEHESFNWFTPEEALRMNLTPETRRVLEAYRLPLF